MRRGFTLIELMFALVGGVLVCLVAFAAVRAAGKTWQRVHRISQENQLLAAGILYAMEDLDFWHTYNEFSNYAAGPGRVAPCNPLNFAHAAPFNDLPLPNGWSDLTFRADDPEWWYSGPDYNEPTQWVAPNVLFIWAHGKWYLTGNRSDNPTNATMSDGRVVRLFPFSNRQIMAKHLSSRLGFMGLLDYVPANFITGIVAKDSSNRYRFDKEFWSGGSNTGAAVPTTPPTIDEPRDGSGLTWKFSGFPVDQSGFIHNSLGIVTEPSAIAMGGNRINWSATRASGSWTAAMHARSVFRLHNQAIDFIHLLPRDGAGGTDRPADVPELRVQTRHFYNWRRIYSVLNVRLLDPDTGVSETLAMPVTSSTLRGARRQRAGLPLAGHAVSLEPAP